MASRDAAPAPGSSAARDAGCRCPVLDNSHGLGYLGGVKDKDGETIFVVNAECPLHADTSRIPLNTVHAKARLV